MQNGFPALYANICSMGDEYLTVNTPAISLFSDLLLGGGFHGLSTCICVLLAEYLFYRYLANPLCFLSLSTVSLSFKCTLLSLY